MDRIIGLKDFNTDNEAAEKLIEFLEKADDENLFHIDVYALADLWGINRKDCLNLFIYGLHKGFFTMSWEFHCPHCGGIANEALSIHEAKTSDYCSLCRVDFSNRIDDNIEVFFSVHPEIKKLSPELKKQYEAEVMNSLMKIKSFKWNGGTVIRGADIIQNDVFRELMGAEVLLPDQTLELTKAVILFTDVKGSTRLYTELGDSKAFLLVREHFKILFEYIKKHNGIPVKTIGDAVMGAFTNTGEALTAALEAQKALISYYSGKPESERIEVKIGLHSGTVIIVTLNSKLDYFGSTVNMAARIQASALPNEIVISEAVFSSDGNRKLISRFAKKIRRVKRTFKGLNGEYDVYHIPMK